MAAESGRDIDRAVVRGVAWTGALRWTAQIISWASTFVLVRLLAPSDYGLAGMATAFYSWATVVAEFGIGTAILTGRDLDRRTVEEVHGAAMLVGGSVAMVGMGASWLLADFYGQPAVRGFVLALSLTLVIDALRIVPTAMLQRELSFRSAALVDFTKAVGQTATVVGAAWAGAGAWALVLGLIVSSALSGVGALWRYPLRPRRPTWERIRPTLALARHALTANLSWSTYTTADLVVAGRMLGPAALGAYSLAWTIASLPSDRLLNIVTAVTRSLFAALKDDVVQTRRYLSLMIEGIGLVVAVPLVGLVLVADLAIPLLLGERWGAAVWPLRLLVVSACFSAVGVVVTQVLVSRGGAALAGRLSLATAAVLIPGFVLGARLGGATGIAVVWASVTPVFTALRVRAVLPAAELPWAEFRRALRPGGAACLGMTLLVGALRLAGIGAPGEGAHWPDFLILVVAGGATALAIATRFDTPVVRSLGQRLRGAAARLGRRAAGSPASAPVGNDVGDA